MRRVLWIAVAVLVAAALGLWRWEHPARVLGTADVDRYLAAIDAGAALPEAEKRDLLARLRAWGEADDGKPVFMLNLMRDRGALRPLSGLRDPDATPRAANAYYESVAFPLLLRSGAYPLFAGEPAGVPVGGAPHTSVIHFDGAIDDWSRVLVVRYPDRRTFLEYVSDPAFLAVMPYKLAALEVSLVPLRDEVTVPDASWVVAALLVLAALLAGALVAMRPRAVDGTEVLHGHRLAS
jgi:hypothetical protein